ncbi:MAG: hypothetical protein ACRCXZ_06280 [Patescibacteria group bacterium]
MKGTLLLPPLTHQTSISQAVNSIESSLGERFRIRVKNCPEILKTPLINELHSDSIKPEILEDRIAFSVSGQSVIEGYVMYIHDMLLNFHYSTEGFSTKFDPGYVGGIFPKCAIATGINRSFFQDDVLLFAEYNVPPII